MSSVRSILIVRLSALGDVIHVLPALAALREAFPTARIGWAVEKRNGGLLEGHSQIDRLHVFPRKAWLGRLQRGGSPLKVMGELRQVVADIRRERYEVAIDFQANFRSGVVTRLSGARRRIGQPRPFAREGSRLFFTETPAPIPREAHKIERNLRLLEPLGICPPEAPRSVLPNGSGPSWIDGLPLEDAPLVLIQAGVSAFGALKAWPEERFAALGTRLAAEGALVLFAWGSQRERSQAERLVAQAPGTHLSPPTETLGDLASLVRHADLLVAVDSGPLHLGAAVGTPVLGLYGPKHPGTYGPYWPGSRVVRANEPCSPCRHRRCPRPDARVVDIPEGGSLKISPCMAAISVEAAFEEAQSLLADTEHLV